jgi:amino-acid N-acetyltransferase
VIRSSNPGDLPAVLALLRDTSLPAAGVEEHFDSFLVARAEGGGLVGCVGLERYGSVGLLRSLAVDCTCRGEAVGEDLVEELLAMARSRGVETLYLLTTTAEHYFPRFGFEVIPREEADPELARSEELRGACPSSAVLMRRRL